MAGHTDSRRMRDFVFWTLRDALRDRADVSTADLLAAVLSRWAERGGKPMRASPYRALRKMETTGRVIRDRCADGHRWRLPP